MPAGLSVALALLADTAAYGPAAPPAPPKPAVKLAADGCATARASANTREIVICAQRPNGYRLDPDVMTARREKKQGMAGRPHNPHEAFRDNSCATVGPMGCRGGAAINLVAAAITAATMAKRLVKGEEVGTMFETDPHQSEYQLYVEAKARREANEAEKAAAAKAKAAASRAATAPPPAPAR